jgi:hypothetical protein
MQGAEGMSTDGFESLAREDVLDGLFGRHSRAASTVLLAIENRTAHLVAQSKQEMEHFLTEEVAEKRELVFLEALALGRDPPLHPTIQNLERCAPQWAFLVPENPRVQAAVAHLLGRKYDFSYQAVPAIRATLCLDTQAVQQAYQTLYGASLEEVFAVRTALSERLRWAWAALSGWLESLPPLPIALASIGPLGGVVILIVMGLVNILTIIYMAEAVARSGTIRYGTAFLGRVATDYLGSGGALILSLGLTIECILTLWPFYIGFSTTLTDATRIPAPVWVLVLFLIGLYYLRRDTLSATIASALVIGAINIGLILILSLLTFGSVRPENLRYTDIPFLGGHPFDPSILQLIFGVILLAYFGHLSVSNCARVVLRRDPSARSLIRGAIAAQAVVMIIYCIWVLAVNGAIAPQVLTGQSGTVLAPLAAEIGPVVHVLGSVFVVLGMGIGTIHSSLPLFSLVRERLPTKRWLVVMLPQRQGRLLLHASGRGMNSGSGDLRLGLTYLGLEPPAHSRGDARPRLRLDIQEDGATHHVEIVVTGSWDVTALFDRLPALRQYDVRLALETLDADQAQVRLRISSPLRLTYEGEWYAAGLSTADILDLPDAHQQIITWMTREGITGRGVVSLTEVATHIGKSKAETRAMLKTLVEQGFVEQLEVEGEAFYRPRLVVRGGRSLPREIWQALSEEDEIRAGGGPEGGLLQRGRDALLSKQGLFFLATAPVTAVFVLVEWLLLTGAESFSEPLSFLGVIVISMLGGTFPVLLLIASRSKGEVVPGMIYRLLGHPLLTGSIYLLFLANLFLHGLVIWENPLQRAAALAAGVLMLGGTAIMARRGAFAPRVVVELREDQREQRGATFAITAGGQPVTAEVRLGYPEGEQNWQASAGDIPTPSALRYASFQLPATQARELKVWTHKITTGGDSERLPTLLKINYDDTYKDFDLGLSQGQVLVPFNGQACHVTIAFPENTQFSR